MSVGRLAWALPRVFAHRGGGALAPENTLAGLRLAARLGFSAVEFDVMLSADGTPWLLHDETLERTTNGSGRVCATPDRVLAGLDAGTRHHPAFAGEPPATLAAAAALCRQLGLQANVEIKPAAGFALQTGEVVACCVRELWAGDALPLVSSFSPAALSAARAACPELPLACLYEQADDDWRQRVAELGAATLNLNADQLGDHVLAAARQAGIPVLAYTVNDPAAAAALHRRGVQAVFSDRLDLFAAP